MKKIINKAGIALILSIFLLNSCKEDEPTDITNYDFQPILTHIAKNIITETYIDLHTRTSDLITAVELLQSTPTVANLEAARQAWRDSRKPWEQSEGFLFGPVATNGIDPSLDSWPVNVVDLDAVLSSPAVLTEAYVDGLEGTLKGFHTLEYLLWGTDGIKTIDAFSAREFEYLIATAQSLKNDAFELKHSWEESGENFQINLADAGEANSIYVSQKSALQEIVNGLIAIADEVGNGKINDPFTQLDITLEESRFSANSKEDFMDNIRSIQNVYLGNYALTGEGITVYIASVDADLDAHFKTEIQSAIDLIEAIPGTFTTAIFDSPTAVANAQEAVRHLQEQLESEVKPIIDAL